MNEPEPPTISREMVIALIATLLALVVGSFVASPWPFLQ